jgi:hypothetical protein
LRSALLFTAAGVVARPLLRGVAVDKVREG